MKILLHIKLSENGGWGAASRRAVCDANKYKINHTFFILVHRS